MDPEGIVLQELEWDPLGLALSLTPGAPASVRGSSHPSSRSQGGQWGAKGRTG